VDGVIDAMVDVVREFWVPALIVGLVVGILATVELARRT
jgi:hypothetical protein